MFTLSPRIHDEIRRGLLTALGVDGSRREASPGGQNRSFLGQRKHRKYSNAVGLS
jgi:hypothetical protein